MTALETRRRKRWESFLQHPERGESLLLVEFPSDDESRPPLHWDRTKERIEWAWGKYRRQMKRLDWLDDHRLPYLDCLSGTEVFAAAFGCEVSLPDNDMPFAIPLVHNPDEADKLSVPSLDAPSLSCQFELADALADRAVRDALVRLPDIQSPMDIAAMVWDKNDFFVSMIDAPDAVVELAEKARMLLCSFLDEWFARYGTTFIAHYPDYFMPAGLTLSEDEIGSVSPECFAQMFLPELNFLSDRYGGIGLHCCANAEHQWPGFKHVENLRLLNLNQPGDVIERALEVFESHTTLLPVPAPWPPEETRAASVVYSVPARDDEDARRIVEEFAAAASSEKARGAV